ncbi:MAG: DUF6058 family natural product biosynthesis protein [Pseudomonadota bacterium]
MSTLDLYLASHFLNAEQTAAASAISVAELDALIDARCVPAPSYVVSASGTVSSFVFGEMAAPGSAPGRYFHRAQAVWIARARQLESEVRLRERFTQQFGAALATLNLSTWRLRDAFDASGAPIADGLRTRTDNAWKFFLNGTFGLCVANPIAEAQIAYKEVLQEKLTQLSDNGAKHAYDAAQVPLMAALIDAYAAAAMPFSPIDYARSSRKRLVEDLRIYLR